ncbi:MAG: CpsD/CapB family tyrosine-protein kinase, partial [Acidaminococcaceae bacterium]
MNNLIAREDPKSPVSEAFRTIRTNIQFAGVYKPMKCIAFTSCTQDEGKSIVVANLGIVMAQAGHKVILLDCDFRNPTQHKLFQLHNKGLSNCIASGTDVFEIIQHSGTPGLDILTSGPVAPNPSEILASERMKEVLAALQDRYDYVLIDMPPVLPVTDAAVMASR